MAKVRLGFADVALARPLTWALLKGEHAEIFNTAVLPHRRVAPLLAEGALDLGLVTAAECEQHGLHPLPDLGVVLVRGGDLAPLVGDSNDGAEKPAASLGECPGCQQIAAAVSARLNTPLAGRRPANVELHPEERSPAVRDPIDLGGASIHGPPQDETIDLAQSYFEQFAVEPVAYVWAHRADFDARSAEFALKSSLRFGLNGLSALSRELAAELRISAALVEQTLRAGVRYVRPTRSMT